MKKLLTVILLFVSVGCVGQSPEWIWAKKSSGNSIDYGYSIATDANGNSYVTGAFASSTVIFDSEILTSEGFGDVLIAKYDTWGNVVWAKSGGGPGAEEAFGICVDANHNSYITGYFYGASITFGDTTLINSGNEADLFVVKYDDFGNVVWARSAGQADYPDFGTSISIDKKGNVLVTGCFKSRILNFGNDVISCNDIWDMLVLKYDATGNEIWARSAGGDNPDFGQGISTDANGNCYITGMFNSSSITFGNTVLNNASGGATDFFIAKYDSLGNAIWARQAGSFGGDQGYSISTDAIGNSYVTGRFTSSAIAFGNTTLINAGVSWDDIFVVKYDSAGNVVWAKRAGGIYGDYGMNICTDGHNNCYVTGQYESPTISFDNYTFTNNDSPGNYNVFVAKYDSIGNVIYALDAGGGDTENGYGISLDAAGNAYVTGSFNSLSIDFGNINLTGGNDLFIAKIGESGTGINEVVDKNDIHIYPNPATTTLTLSTEQTLKNAELKIMNAIGQEVSHPLSRGECASLSAGKGCVLDISSLPPGLYYLTLQSEEGVATKKFEVIR